MTSKWTQDVQWSPVHPETFFSLSVGTNQVEFNQFAVEPLANYGSSKPSGRQVSETGFARLQFSKSDLFTNNKDEVQRIKCFACYPKAVPENLLGLGLSTGKVLLTSFVSDPQTDPTNLIGAEFPPKHSRLCTSLAWNAVDSKLLAVSFDKYRTDCSLSIYDVTVRGGGGGHTRPLSVGSERDTRGVTELVYSDALHSMAWLPHQPLSLMVGQGQKNLRLYDIRDPSKHKSSAITKSVYGISADPLYEHRLASFFEDQMNIWDLRHFEKPVLSFRESRGVIKLGWSPTRYGTLACLTKQSNVIKLYNIQHVGQEVEYTEKHVKPNYLNQHQVAIFAWHPNQENRMLALSPGGAMQDLTIYDAISLDWSPHSTCSVASGRHLFYCLPSSDRPTSDEDISTTMKRRACNGYGMKTDPLSQNASLAGNDGQVKKLWHWLQRIKSLRTVSRSASSMKSSAPSSSPGTMEFCGVKQLMCREWSENPQSGGGLRSKVEPMAWDGLDGTLEANVFRSKERSHALRLCGWDFDGDHNAFRDFTQRLETEGRYERAAAICVFHLKMRQAIDILNRGAEAAKDGSHDLHPVAMALSGFTPDKDTLWCSMCSALCRQLRNPYLRAMFGFLTTNDDKYEAVVRELEISIEDRVAFACIFLNDVQLVTFVQDLTLQVVTDGNLAGVLLTGLTKDGVELLQSYVDRTADVQTASLVAVQALSPDLYREESVQHWIESYRQLLDTWRLWHERAKFDLLYQAHAKEKVSKQIYVSCHFCQSPISPSELAKGGKSGYMGGYARAFQQRRANTCYKCRKALPRCALCLMHMGTRSGESKLSPHQRSYKSSGKPTVNSMTKQTDFGEWFSWCQSCRHGGHADHLTEWFRTHSECPVTSCVCRCMILDSVASVSPSTELSVM
nr:GATOR complex protein MIOS-like [Lytechinus pictus]